MNEDRKVLVVEDDGELQEALCDTLRMSGFKVVCAGDGEEALRCMEMHDIALVVSDVQMRPMDGVTLLRRVKARLPELPVVLMTAYGTIQRAVSAMREGAADYLVKPFEASVLVEMVTRLFPMVVDDGEVIAEDSRTRELLSLAGRVAGTEATVMITGPSGSGKEVFARIIHRQSRRAAGPFIALNCAAIPESMLEAILFGYEKGAFTGAHEARPGKFEQANGGTLLLDEITEMDLNLQSKLLRVLQEREVERLGGQQLIDLDVRVLATSNRNLEDAVSEGCFREDLFYRLNVFPLHLPPLAARAGDILPLARLMLKRHAGREVEMDPHAEQFLLAHDWPGNVRELDNVMQRALILSNGQRVTKDHILLQSAPGSGAGQVDKHAEPEACMLESDLKQRESRLILDTLAAVNGNRTEVAKRLGISPRTLRYKLARMRESGVAIPG